MQPAPRPASASASVFGRRAAATLLLLSGLPGAVHPLASNFGRRAAATQLLILRPGSLCSWRLTAWPRPRAWSLVGAPPLRYSSFQGCLPPLILGPLTLVGAQPLRYSFFQSCLAFLIFRALP